MNFDFEYFLWVQNYLKNDDDGVGESLADLGVSMTFFSSVLDLDSLVCAHPIYLRLRNGTFFSDVVLCKAIFKLYPRMSSSLGNEKVWR